MEKVQLFPCLDSCILRADVTDGTIVLRGWDQSQVKVIDESPGALEMEMRSGHLDIDGGRCNLSIWVPRNCQLDIDGRNLELDGAGIIGPTEIDVTGGYVVLRDWRGELGIDANTANIKVGEYEGSACIDTSAGKVEIENCAGIVRVDTGDGEVVVQNTDAALEVDTGRGDVSILSAHGAMLISTASGNVKIQDVFSRNLQVDAGGSIKALLPGGNPGQWQLESAKGEVMVTVPDNLSAWLDLNGQDLEVDELELTNRKEYKGGFSGCYNQGQGRVSIAGRRVVARRAAPVTVHDWKPAEGPHQEEALEILKMLEQGTISTTEAEKLLDALGEGNRNE